MIGYKYAVFIYRPPRGTCKLGKRGCSFKLLVLLRSQMSPIIIQKYTFMFHIFIIILSHKSIHKWIPLFSKIILKFSTCLYNNFLRILCTFPALSRGGDSLGQRHRFEWIWYMLPVEAQGCQCSIQMVHTLHCITHYSPVQQWFALGEGIDLFHADV